MHAKRGQSGRNEKARAPKRRPRTGLRKPRVPGPAAQARFLESIAGGYSAVKAAELAGFHRQRFYELKDANEAFSSAWDEAYEAGTQVIEDELRRRAVDGVEDVKWVGPQDGGREIDFKHFSDNLLMFLLKGRRPGMYRDNARVELTGPNGGPLQHETGGLSLSDFTADELRALREIRQNALERKEGGDGDGTA